MFPLTFIEVGNTLSQQIIAASEITTAKSTIEKFTQHLLLKHQQHKTFTDVIERANLTRLTLLQVIRGSSSSSGSEAGIDGGPGGGNGGVDALDGFDTDSLFSYVPPMQRPETVLITILFLIIFIVGVLGNGTLVIIFFRHRSMRNIPNTYILSLALADLLVIIVCVPLAILVYTTDSWTFGKTMCQVTEFFKDVSIGVSVFTLTALSGERYCAIVNPLRKLQTKPLTVLTAAMIWLLSIMFATPSLIMSDLQQILIDDKTNLTITICTPFGKQRNNSEIYARYVVVTKAFVYYLLPLFIIAVLYLMMAQRLHVSAREMPGETLSTQSRSQIRARRYVARMVVAFVVVFFICFFPYHLFELWFHLNPTAREDFDELWHTIRIIGFCTYFLNSCVNPVALYCVSGVFRAHFNQYLCCLCVKRQMRPRQHSTGAQMLDSSVVNISLRSTINYNRTSIHLNTTHRTAAGGYTAAGYNNNSNSNSNQNSNNRTNANGMRRPYSHHVQPRHSTVQLSQNGTGVVGGKTVAVGVDNECLTAATAAVQSGVILCDKR